MSEGLTTASYITAAVLFIVSLAWLSRHETSNTGNKCGIAGMAIALIMTVFNFSVVNIIWIFIIMIIGGTIGIYLARRVKIAEIPEFIAVLHSFVNLSAILVGLNSYFSSDSIHQGRIAIIIHLFEAFLSIFIGAVTFTGSITAFKKLHSQSSLRSVIQTNRYQINLAICLVSLSLLIMFIFTTNTKLQILSLLIMTVIALIFGWYLVSSVSGSDMPVVISMLNSYSGWAAAMSGFLLSNDLLIVTGALVGSSGSILSYIMCKSMNRSFFNVISGITDIDDLFSVKEGIEEKYNDISVEEAADILKYSRSVIIAPGYGMAVAQAQFSVAELTKKLLLCNIKVRFGIHPVAGRLPGHMNVLLAEAKIPYDIVVEMDKINDDFSSTDTVLVIGSNDTVNPSAKDDPKSLIAGMPVLEVWKAKNVIVLKRSTSTGYSGIKNPLFFKENTYILFGDAKTSIEAINNALVRI